MSDDTAPTTDREVRDDGLPALDPSIVEDDELLGVAVDQVIHADPDARRRSAEIVMYQGFLQAIVEDAGTWRLVLEIESRTSERWADLSVAIARWAFEHGRRFPLPPTPPEGGAS